MMLTSFGDDERCELCGVEKHCLGLDASYGEYDITYVCRPCVDKLFEEGEAALLEHPRRIARLEQLHAQT